AAAPAQPARGMRRPRAHRVELRGGRQRQRGLSRARRGHHGSRRRAGGCNGVSSLVAAPADARPLARREKLALAAEILVAYARARWWMRRRDLPGALRALRVPVQGVAAPPAGATLTGRRLGRAVI